MGFNSVFKLIYQLFLFLDAKFMRILTLHAKFEHSSCTNLDILVMIKYSDHLITFFFLLSFFSNKLLS